MDDAALALSCEQLHELGFTVLRDAMDGAALRREVEQVLADSAARAHATSLTTFRFAPMMTARTPHSLALLDALEVVATGLLGGAVLPTRAKGVGYSGSTRWHRDSARPVASIGFLAYLDTLTADNGALRVLPGSHRTSVDVGDAERAAESPPGTPLPTRPGDVICFDEHLLHASEGGAERLQWRVDFVRAPRTDAEIDDVRAMFAGIFAADWDGGYDPDVAPNYDRAWLASSRASVEPLASLGVYQMAAAQEAAMRARRSSIRGR